MQNLFVFKTTRGNNYVLDSSTNMILPIDNNLAYLINCNDKLDRNLIYHNTTINLKNMMDKWCLFKKDKPIYDYMIVKKELYFNPLPQLILNITENCNLRCNYCIFSGKITGYRERTDKKMSFKIAKKSIDNFAKYLKQTKAIPQRYSITFYGGEPMLEYDLIKDIVKYIKKINLKPSLGFTTNGTLLDDEKIKYLVENNFFILFSLDGPSEIHDKNRYFPSKKGSYEKVNLNFIKYQEELKKQNKTKKLFSMINTCIENNTDMIKLNDYFLANKKVYQNTMIRISNIFEGHDSYNNNNEKQFNPTMQKLFEQFKFRLKNFQIDEDNSDLFFLNTLFGNPLRVIYNRTIMPYGNIYNDLFGGSCIPGIKLFVSVDGTYHICEKINENFSIGDCEMGLDEQEINKHLKLWSDSFWKQCDDCAFKAICGVCMAVCAKNNIFDFHTFCSKKKSAIINELKFLYRCLEEYQGAWAYLSNVQKKRGYYYSKDKSIFDH